MIQCSRCGKENQDHYKFCLGCGSELPRAAHEPRKFTGHTPPSGVVRNTDRQVYSQSAGQGTIVSILPDGSEGERLSFQGEQEIGRTQGGMFGNDSFLSPTHATFRFQDSQLLLQDEESLNGTYVRVQPEEPVSLSSGDVFRIGQEIIQFRALSLPSEDDVVVQMGSPVGEFIGRIVLVTGRRSTGNAYPIPRGGLHLGRERGDIIFPDDGYVSGLHCRLYSDGEEVLLEDLGSSNGTFTKIRDEVSVASGSIVLLGQQIYRIDF